MSFIEHFNSEYDNELVNLQAEVEALKITNRTLQEQLDKLSAPSAEPVGEVIDPTYVKFYNNKQFPYGTQIYTAPLYLSAAVYAAREQDAQIAARFYPYGVGRLCNELRALQDPAGLKALREFGIRIAQAMCTKVLSSDTVVAFEPVDELVDRVLKGE